MEAVLKQFTKKYYGLLSLLNFIRYLRNSAVAFFVCMGKGTKRALLNTGTERNGTE